MKSLQRSSPLISILSLAMAVSGYLPSGAALGQQSPPRPGQMNKLPPVPSGQTPPNPARPAQQAAAPKLSITPAQPPVSVAPVCKSGAPLVSVNVVVQSSGPTPYVSPANAFSLIALDDGKPSWMGRAPLPSLTAASSRVVSIPLYPPSYFTRADGPHRFTVYAPWGKTAPIAVTLPAGVCGELSRRFRASVVTKLARPAPMQATPMGLPHNPPTVPQQLTAADIELAKRMGKLVGPPTDLTSTVDPKICGDHGGLGGGLACTALLPQGRMALVWTWTGPAVDGFNVYRVDGNQRTRAGRQANGRDATMYIVDPVPADGYAGKCYAVSAYRGPQESPLSRPFCTNGGNIVQTASITPDQVRGVTKARYYSPGFLGTSALWGVDDTIQFVGGVAEVGYMYQSDKRLFGDTFTNQISRVALHFDGGAFYSHHIYSAHLKMTVSSNNVGPDAHNDYTTSCAARIAVGNYEWWTKPEYWFDNISEALHPGVYNGPNVSFDVTSIVQQWAQVPKDNYGLVLKGENEDLGAFTNDNCDTTYDATAIQLEVQYY